ncbi:MAG: hypothetical protein KGO96_04930 [Elusimicrobia bacterium]|nr:hypothetical protein [Elusimicrobiota bacterium]MDE2237101.1 hypothetical protein [Elusimicrobiota bacterium]MDE2425235.1 hypothetical protein [Elusimicrobiota bacterium]
MKTAASGGRRLWPCLLCAAALSGCVTPQVAINPHANFSSIQRVAVVTFGGPDGDIAADLLTQQLVAAGANVIERQQLSAILSEQGLARSGLLDPRTVKQVGKILGVDALFVGTVALSQPSQSYVVTNNGKGSWQSVTPVNGGAVVPAGPLLGVPNSQVFTTDAQASVVARLIDVETGTILWSASMSYEGLDVPSAMQGIMEGFVQSLVPIWPSLIAR